MVKNAPARAGDRKHGFNPLVGKIPGSRKWQPTPGFFPGKFHGQRSLDTTEQQHTHMHTDNDTKLIKDWEILSPGTCTT